MNIWIIMFCGGVITFVFRFAFIYLFGKLHLPATVIKALHYVPPAVLSAIVFPEIFYRNGQIINSIVDERLWAGVLAVVVAAISKNTLFTIITGMLVLVSLQYIFY